MNSFRAVERAIAYEIERQGRALDAGEPLTMETRGWDDGRQATYRMRAKETSDDYRYFPDPDLPPLRVDEAWIAAIRGALPELPAARRARYEALGLSGYDAAVLVADPGMRRRVRGDPRGRAGRCRAKEVANFVTGPRPGSRRRPATTRRGIPGAWPARRHRRAARRDRRRRRSRARSAGSSSSATSRTARRPPSCSPAPAPARSRTMRRCSAHVDAVIAANPQGAWPTTGRASPSPGSSSGR